MTTSIAADGILVEVRLPVMPAGAGYAVEEFARRHGDFAVAAVTAVILREGDRCARPASRPPASRRIPSDCARPSKSSSNMDLATAPSRVPPRRRPGWSSRWPTGMHPRAIGGS